MRGQDLFKRPSIPLALSTIRVTCKSHDRLLEMVTPRPFTSWTRCKITSPRWYSWITGDFLRMAVNTSHLDALNFKFDSWFQVLKLVKSCWRISQSFAAKVVRCSLVSSAYKGCWYVRGWHQGGHWLVSQRGVGQQGYPGVHQKWPVDARRLRHQSRLSAICPKGSQKTNQEVGP